VRAYPDERQSVELRVPAADLPVDDGDVDRVSVMWPHNDRLLARDRPERDGDDWIYEVQIPPGRHGFSFVANDDPGNEHRDEVTVPGPGARASRCRRPSSRVGREGGRRRLIRPDRCRHRGAARPRRRGRCRETHRRVPVAVDFLVDDRDADPETVARIESLAAGDTLTIPLAELSDDLSGGIRVHAVPNADRYGAAETIRIERDEEGPWAPARAAP